MKIKKLKICLLAICCVCSFSQLKSQDNISFLGKRVSLNFSGTVSPALANPSIFTDETNKTKAYFFNFDICPNVEAIVWKEGSVGAVYHWYKTKYTFHNWIYLYTDPLTGMSYHANINETSEIKVQGFGIYYKQYLPAIFFGDMSSEHAPIGEVRAPIGTYMRFQYDNYSYLSKMENKYINATLKGNINAAKIEIGRDYVFFDKIRFSTGMSVGAMFCKISREEFGIENFTNEEKMKRYINNRLFFQYLVGASVSVGFFVF